MFNGLFSHLIYLCLAVSNGPEAVPAHPSFPYDLKTPNGIYEMPDELKEISGLSMSGVNQLAAINDEEGIIFLLNKNTCVVERKIKFWDEGDYEGVEIVGDDAYVIKSSGTLYFISDFMSDTAVTVKIKSFLNKENDVEGLAHSPGRNGLYVGCKGKSMEGEGGALKKAIFQFDITNSVMVTEPLYLLTLPDIQEYLTHLDEEDHNEKLSEYFAEGVDELKFSPSGIAVHPITGEVYVTSSKGKMLLVLSEQGKILHLVKLEKKRHAQPEGICFDADGTMYIANEGKDDDPGLIFKFLYSN